MTPRPAVPLPDSVTQVDPRAPLAVRAMQMLERTTGLDRLAAPIGRIAAPTGMPAVRRILLGEDVGHALHPFLTDLPIGFWASSVLVDLLDRQGGRRASRDLLVAGLVAAVPAAATGLAEWRTTARPETRVASAHGMLNSVALVLYGASLATRGRSRRTGLAFALAGTGVTAASGFLGGHLAIARKTGSRHAAYEADGVGPALARTSGVAAV
jgi:uncharacterized membrane protein